MLSTVIDVRTAASPLGLGSATAAITEQLLCASAATVVMCNRRGACACGRGLDSGFVSAIKFYRARMGLSVRGDAAGGIFSF